MLLAFAFDRGGPGWEAALLTAGIAAGECLVLRPERGPAVPASHAVVLVALRVLTLPVFVVASVVGLAIGSVLDPPRDRTRGAQTARRLVTVAAAFGAYTGVTAIAPNETTGWVLGALAAAAAAQVATDLALDRGPALVRLREWGSARERVTVSAAAVAVATSGVLMALVATGTDVASGGERWLGVVLAVPLLAAWYADRLAGRARRNYHDTIEALAVVPELGGVAPPGRSERVTALTLAVGVELDLPPEELDDLEAAARLHQLGAVCLRDEPAPVPAPAGVSSPVAETTASILRGAPRLDRAAVLVAAAGRGPVDPYGPGETPDPAAAAVLRAVTAFCDLTATAPGAGRATLALRRLRAESDDTYDPVVLDALEAVLGEEIRPGPL